MVRYEDVLKEELVEKAEILKVLGHPERLAIALLLAEKEMCVKDLVEVLGVSQPKVSQHVGIMKELGLLSFRKEGTRTLYRLLDGEAREILEILFDEE